MRGFGDDGLSTASIDRGERMAKHPPVDYRKLAERRESFSGPLEVAELQRLGGLIEEPRGSVEFELELGFDDRGFVRAIGFVKATLPLLCQRSLQVYDQPLERDIDLALVRNEAQEARFGDAADVVILEQDAVRVDDLVEDELILSIPLVPIRPGAELLDNPAAAPDDAPVESEQKTSPFAELAALKNSGSSQ